MVAGRERYVAAGDGERQIENGSRSPTTDHSDNPHSAKGHSDYSHNVGGKWTFYRTSDLYFPPAPLPLPARPQLINRFQFQTTRSLQCIAMQADVLLPKFSPRPLIQQSLWCHSGIYAIESSSTQLNSTQPSQTTQRNEKKFNSRNIHM